MRKIVKLTESKLVKLINEVILTIKQMKEQNTPIEPFVYKVYSEDDTESFENTFKQPFPDKRILHFPMVVVGFDAKVPVALNIDRKDPSKNTYEIEDVKIYVPFMFQQVNDRSSWISSGKVRFTKNNIPKNMLEDMVRRMSGITTRDISYMLGASPDLQHNKERLNSPSSIEKKFTDLLTPYTPKLPDLPPKKEYGDFEYAD